MSPAKNRTLMAFLSVLALTGITRSFAQTTSVGSSPSDAIILTASNADKIDEAKTAIIKIHGMICESCEQSIEAKLRKMDGVRAVRISMKKGVAEVVYAANGKVSPPDMVRAIESLGEYKASVVKVL